MPCSIPILCRGPYFGRYPRMWSLDLKGKNMITKRSFSQQKKLTSQPVSTCHLATFSFWFPNQIFSRSLFIFNFMLTLFYVQDFFASRNHKPLTQKRLGTKYCRKINCFVLGQTYLNCFCENFALFRYCHHSYFVLNRIRKENVVSKLKQLLLSQKFIQLQYNIFFHLEAKEIFIQSTFPLKRPSKLSTYPNLTNFSRPKSIVEACRTDCLCTRNVSELGLCAVGDQ